VHDRIAGDYLSPRAARLVRSAARRLPQAVIANSRTTLDTLGPLGCASAVCPPPIEQAAVEHVPGNGSLRVGMVGRIAPWKGQHVFVEAFARAFPAGPERAVVVGAPLFGAGEERYLEDVRDLGERLGLDGRLELTGFRDDVGAELAGLDVLVHASTLPEPFGQVVAEGMAAGLPVVAAAAGGPAELVESGVNGLLYPPGDVEALAGALRTLAADPALRARLGAAARERTRELSPERAAASVLAVYRQVVEARA